MAKYEIINGLTIKNKIFNAGDLINKGDVPKESFDWLIEQKIIVELTPEYKAKKLEEAANVIDDYDTEFEVVGEEE